MESQRVRLTDGTEVLIRPMRRDDLERSVAFFQKLPVEDRVFLRVDVTKRRFVRKRIRDMLAGHVRRIVALVNDHIIADGALELSEHGWRRHVGEMRLIVSREYQRKGLGRLMAREIHGLAVEEGLEELVVRIMRPQDGAHHIVRRLGFRDQVLLPDYVKDRRGERQDLIVLRCRVDEMLTRLQPP